MSPTYRPLRRGNIPSALGNVIHKMYQYVHENFSNLRSEPNVEAVLRMKWNSLVDDESKKLNAEWLGKNVPQPNDWPGMALKRTRCLSTLITRLQGATVNEHPEIRISVEREFRDESLNIYGLVDRIVSDANGVTIVDLKTSSKFEGINRRHTEQLWVYAYLYFKEQGSWPDRLAVEHGGKLHFVAFEAEAVGQFMLEVLAKRDQLEIAIGEGNEVQLAAPSEASCRWCPYKVVCSKYQEVALSEWQHHTFSLRKTPTSTEVKPKFEITSPVDLRAVVVEFSGDIPSELRSAPQFSVQNVLHTNEHKVLRLSWQSLWWIPEIRFGS